MGTGVHGGYWSHRLSWICVWVCPRGDSFFARVYDSRRNSFELLLQASWRNPPPSPTPHALSRVRSIERLVLVEFKQSKIRADPAALAFYEQLEADLAALDSARVAEADFQLMEAALELRQQRTADRQHSRRD